MLSLLFAAAMATAQCDIPGGDLRNFASPDPAACEAECAKEAKCKGFVHISGWNRCFLKAKVGRQAPLRMHAGYPSGGKLAVIKEDHDDSGKDMRRVTGVKTAQACADLCLAEPQCKAFALLEGYGDCWLKKSHGTLRPKVFTCAKKD